jgi:PAS domain S-box-containing protein
VTADSQVVERRRSLPPVPESARAARETVRDAVDEVGRSDLSDTAGLLVSEIVTNAIVHARTSIELDVTAGPAGLRVAVRDRSPNPPVPRHYGRAATTGRGLGLLELLSDRHGTDSENGDGKTVWFELGDVARDSSEDGAAAGTRPHGDDDGREDAAELTVVLEGLPVRLARAWQEHIDALLREHLLSLWDQDTAATGVSGSPSDGVGAGDAFAAVAEAIEGLAAGPDTDPYVDVVLHLRPDAPAHFADFDAVVEHMVLLAHRGLTLAPPTQPEIRLIRAWICREVASQATGAAPQAWPGLPVDTPPPDAERPRWDAAAVSTSTEAVVAADDVNRIVAASPAALDLLGWDDDLIGRRIAAVIPDRHREAHIAAFTMHLLTGQTRIIGREVAVPALRRDGTEVDVLLLVRRVSAADGRPVFTATMRPAGPEA